MRDRLYSTPALIIRRSDVGEADRLLTIYTPQLGKLTVAARGVRKTSSKLAGHLELFVHTQLQLARGRSLDVVTESRVSDHFATLRSDLDRISVAYYVAELLDKMTPEQSDNSALFRLTRDVLAAIDRESTTARRDVVLRFFELHLLSLSGYRPHFFHCAVCERELDQSADRFSPAAGGVVCANCVARVTGTLPLSLSAFKLLRYLLRGGIDDALALNVSPELAQEAGFILRVALKQVLERELKSVEFLNLLRG